VSPASATPVAPPGRLERFRTLRAKLDPTGDPADAERFYLDSSQAVSARIVAELSLAPASSHLLVGGVGSGKTTELLAIARRMVEVPDIATLYVDVSKHHDIARMIPGAVLASVALQLSNRLESRRDAAPLIHAARKMAHGGWEEPDPEDHEYPLVHTPGVLVPPTPSVESLERARGPLAHLLAVLKLDAAHVVVTIDGLDRSWDVHAFDRLVRYDIAALTELGVGVVIVGPLRALYGLERVVAQRFDSLHYQPWLDVRRDSAARDFLTAVLKKRDSDAFDSRAVTSLVSASGGVMRDLLSLTQTSVVEVYMEGAERVEPRHVEAAIQIFGRKHLQGLRPSELEVLQRVRTHGSFVQTSEDDLALLMTRRVLEYRSNDQPRYAVHPTIEPLLAELRQI